MNRPRYLELHERGELERRVEAALARLRACDLCPQECGINRNAGEGGNCEVGSAAQVASFNLHFGEESPLVGAGGSGTIFFAGCNLHCVFCQNYDISHRVDPDFELSPRRLAATMLTLQERGAENINFVSPSHVVPQILEALVIAADGGLELPLVYNTGGYDSAETLALLDGVVDIYMPDIKFASTEVSAKLCQAPDYFEVTRKALKEMHRQVGDLQIDERGVATCGLLVRHLVMPGDLAGTRDWLEFLAADVSADTYVNLMAQYRPCGGVSQVLDEYPELGRGVSTEEMRRAHDDAAKLGITRLDERHRPGMRLLWRMLQDE